MRHKLKPSHADSHQSQPWAIIKFFSFVGKDTLYNSGPASTKTSPNDLASITKVKETVVVNDILKLNVTSAKSNYQLTGQAVLSSGDLNYQALLSPGDHAMIWMGSKKEDYDRISNSVLANGPSNDFNSGLKFVGRVGSVRTLYNTAANGVKTLRYLVTFKGFSEFGNSLYYNHALAPNSPKNQGNSQLLQMEKVYGEISKSWNSYFFSQNGNKGSVQSVIDFLIDVFMGAGPGDEARRAGKAVKSPNSALLIPRELLSILGISSKNSTPNYANMLHTLIGIQQYTNNSFMPNINDSQSISVQNYTGLQLHGSLTTPPDLFNNTPMWSALQQVCNPVINEIYTTMRVNNQRRIVPFFIARQIAFTSKYSPVDGGGAKFIDLPRWVADPALQVGSFNIGTSDAARFNFFQIYGTLYGVSSTSPGYSQQAQIAAGNFSINVVDIMRNGSRNMIQNVMNDFTGADSTLQINEWAQLIKDWYGNAHLKLSGSVSLAGVQEPICVGDNFELAGKLFHIEGVNHDYDVQENGIKGFYTTLDLSQGILSNGAYAFNESENREGLNTGLEPGFSDEERYINDKVIIGGVTPAKKKL